MKTCVAPLTSAPDSPLCGKPAKAERVVGGLSCPLCTACAAEIDRDRLGAFREKRAARPN